jgi:hypothetical protein
MSANEEGTASAIWLYKAFGSKLGVMELTDGQLSLRLGDGKQIFDAPMDQVEVLGWPSYGIAPNSQVKLKVAGKKHRVCFVAPSNADETFVADDLVLPPQLAQLLRTRRALATYPAGQKVGATWHELLGDEK